MGNNLAPIIEELRRAYIELKQNHFDQMAPQRWGYDSSGAYGLQNGATVMPMPVITIQARGRKKVDGWYKPVAWDSQAADALNILAGTTNHKKTIASTDEICIAAEALGKSSEELLTILVHQMVHHYDHHNNVGGKGRNTTQNPGGYHTRQFEQYARKFGLLAEVDGSGGYRNTSIDMTHAGTKLREAIKNVALDDSVFDMFRKSPDTTDKKFVGSKLKKWACGCTNVRVATMLHADCTGCGERFKYADKDRDDDRIKHWLDMHNEGSI